MIVAGIAAEKMNVQEFKADVVMMLKVDSRNQVIHSMYAMKRAL